MTTPTRQPHQPQPTDPHHPAALRAPRFCRLRIGAGHLTLCCKRDATDGRYYIGAAWCAPGDQFCRAKGRLIAEGRASCRREGARFEQPALRGESWRRVAARALYDDRGTWVPTWVAGSLRACDDLGAMAQDDGHRFGPYAEKRDVTEAAQ